MTTDAWRMVQHDLTDSIMFLRQAARLSQRNEFREKRYLQYLRLNAEHEEKLRAAGWEPHYQPAIELRRML